MATGLFLFFWVPRAIVACPSQVALSRRLACKRIGAIFVGPSGAAQAADLDKSPDREGKACQGENVMQCGACRSRKPGRFRELAEQGRRPVEQQKPPRALVAVVQPLGVDGTTPDQPRDKDDDHHDDEKRRGDPRGGEQDDSGEQSCNAKDKQRTPVFGPVDAPAGAEQEFEQVFHSTPACIWAGRPGVRQCVARNRAGGQEQVGRQGYRWKLWFMAACAGFSTPLSNAIADIISWAVSIGTIV